LKDKDREPQKRLPVFSFLQIDQPSKGAVQDSGVHFGST